MHTPVVCICIKNENQANKRPSMALCSREERKRNKTSTQMRQIDGMKENLTKINGKLQETIMMVKKRNESNHFIQRSQAKQ